MKRLFTQNLLKWNELYNKRTMPWKGEKDAYKIWLSEIILQQTRAEQGLSYYEKFLTRFPTITGLAQATDEEVFKLWEGLGYYTRCRNLLHTARFIAFELSGNSPATYTDILKLKGIGPYTAAAIASFAYNLPYAVVDGNVYRVLSRYFGKTVAIDTTEGKAFFQKLADHVLDQRNSSAYNQAIMDFGATVCKPQVPECQHCVMKENCVAYEKAWVNKLPFKSKKLQRKNRWFNYFVFYINRRCAVKQRSEKDIWQNLYEFYLFETDEHQNWGAGYLQQWMQNNLGITHFTLQSISPIYHQQLTHQNLKGQFLTIHLNEVPATLSHLHLLTPDELNKLAFPKMINQYLKQETIA